MKIKNSKRKGISPIIATALLLIVVVVSVVSFENFIGNYQSIIFSDVEQKSIIEKNTKIESFIGNSIYLKNFDDNLNILEIKIDNNICNFSNLSLKLGLNKIKLKKCIKKSGVSDVMILTNKGLIEKKLFLKKVEGCDFGSKFLETGEKILSFKENKISFPNKCESELRTCLKSGKLSGSFEFESCEVEPLDYFMSVLKDSTYATGRDVLELSDGNFMLTGGVQGLDGFGNQDIFLKKVDKNGQEIWNKLYGSSKTEQGLQFIQAKSGDIYSVGYSDGLVIDEAGSRNQAFVNKFDSKGESVWSKVLYKNSNTPVGMAFDIVEVGENEFVFGGYSGSFTSKNAFFLSKIDENGKKIWSKALYDNSKNTYLRKLISLKDSFVMVGSLQTDSIVAKFDLNGNQIWAKSIGGSKNDAFESIVSTSDGGFLVVGASNSFTSLAYQDVFVVKLDSSGNKEWAKTIVGTRNDFAKDVFEDSNGNFIITGYFMSFGGTDYDIFVSKFDKDGEIVSTKLSNSSETKISYGNSILGLEDDSFFLTGHTSDFGGEDYDLFLLKLNSSGSCNGCSEIIDLDISSSDANVVVNDVSLNMFDVNFDEKNIDLDVKEVNAKSEYIFYG